jgi:hypothetical protein
MGGILGIVGYVGIDVGVDVEAEVDVDVELDPHDEGE